MPCCGQKRTQAEPERTPPVYFQYVGNKSLTLLGPVSQKRYRFDHPGAVVAISSRDKRALAGVPFLRQVRGSAKGTD